MSKIAVLSDIHANIDALNLVLKDIEKKNVDKIICLGDLVTKYFYPDKVVDAIKENCFIYIKGNCDNLVATNQNYKFARSKLGLDRIEFLDTMPIYGYLKINDIRVNLYHSSPNSLDKIFNPCFSGNKYTPYKDKIITDYTKMFEDNNPQVSLVGHTHQNYIGIEQNNKLKLVKKHLLIDKNDRVIINVGSAGEHSHLTLKRDATDTIIDPYLTYLLLEDKDGLISTEIIKVDYKEILNKVYLDMVKNQNAGIFPNSPNDTKKLEKSLRLM